MSGVLGSGLVGAVFPVPSIGEGQLVALSVDGDVRRVFEGYVQQAEDLGFPLTPRAGGQDGQWCTDPNDGNTDDDPTAPFQVRCDAFGSDPNAWQVSLRGFAEQDGKGYIYLDSREFSDAPPLPPLESDGPTAPATDDELAPDLAPATDDPPLRVVEGSELVTDPLPSDCITGGYVAILRVTGELLPVIRGYLEQFLGTTAFTSEGLVGDADQPRVVASAAGGGTLIAVGVAGDPSYILIERCND